MSFLVFAVSCVLQRRRRKSLPHQTSPRAHPPKKQKAACSTREASPITTLHTVKPNHHLYPSPISFAAKKKILPINHHHLHLHYPPFPTVKSNPIHSNATPIASPPKNSAPPNASRPTSTINSATPPRYTVKYATTHNHSSSRASN